MQREGFNPEQIRNEAFAYADINQNQQTVLNIISEKEPITNEQIAKILGWYPHQVTPRVLELRQAGIVEYCGHTISNISRRKASLWRVKQDYQSKINYKN